MYWSWILTAVGVFGLYLAGSKRWQGWAVGLGAQVLWFSYAIATKQYGFIISAFAYGFVYARNLRKWQIAQQSAGEPEEWPSQKALQKHSVMLPLEWVLTNYVPGSAEYALNSADSWTWDDEHRDLMGNDFEAMTALIGSIMLNGMQEPVLLGDDRRVWNGHHRIVAAKELGMTRIPVAFVAAIRETEQAG
jgi:hypothetical protein